MWMLTGSPGGRDRLLTQVPAQQPCPLRGVGSSLCTAQQRVWCEQLLASSPCPPPPLTPHPRRGQGRQTSEGAYARERKFSVVFGPQSRGPRQRMGVCPQQLEQSLQWAWEASQLLPYSGTEGAICCECWCGGAGGTTHGPSRVTPPESQQPARPSLQDCHGVLSREAALEKVPCWEASEVTGEAGQPHGAQNLGKALDPLFRKIHRLTQFCL